MAARARLHIRQLLYLSTERPLEELDLHFWRAEPVRHLYAMAKHRTRTPSSVRQALGAAPVRRAGLFLCTDGYVILCIKLSGPPLSAEVLVLPPTMAARG
jgi:hypothetical protein